MKEEQTSRNAASVALLRGWLRDEATDDPAQIQKAQEELDEFKRSINANRAATGERLPFPLSSTAKREPPAGIRGTSD